MAVDATLELDIAEDVRAGAVLRGKAMKNQARVSRLSGDKYGRCIYRRIEGRRWEEGQKDQGQLTFAGSLLRIQGHGGGTGIGVAEAVAGAVETLHGS